MLIAPDGNCPAGTKKEGLTVKRIIWAALTAATCVVLLAGKDDIRRFHHMRHM